MAVTLCGGAFHIFNKLYNMVPKSECERIMAEKLAEEVRQKQLTETQTHEVSRPEPQQPQIVVQNTIVNQHEIINEVVNNVVNDITNNNVNIAVADSSSASIASAEADAYSEPHPAENSKSSEVTSSGFTAAIPTEESESASENEEEVPTVDV